MSFFCQNVCFKPIRARVLLEVRYEIVAILSVRQTGTANLSVTPS